MGFFTKDGQQQKSGEDEQKSDVAQVLEALPNMIQQAVTSANQQLFQHMQQQSQQQQQQQPQPQPEPPKNPLEEVEDFENLGNRDLVQLMASVIDQRLEGLQTTSQKQLEDLSMRIQQKELRDDLDKVYSQEKEVFDLYREDMRSLANRYPDLAPQDLFALAKSKNPEPAQKYEEEKAEEERKAKAEEEEPFGGLLPTSGRAAENTEGMKFPDAAEKAWEKTMQNVPDNIIGGGNH